MIIESVLSRVIRLRFTEFSDGLIGYDDSFGGITANINGVATAIFICVASAYRSVMGSRLRERLRALNTASHRSSSPSVFNLQLARVTCVSIRCLRLRSNYIGRSENYWHLNNIQALFPTLMAYRRYVIR